MCVSFLNTVYKTHEYCFTLLASAIVTEVDRAVDMERNTIFEIRWKRGVRGK